MVISLIDVPGSECEASSSRAFTLIELLVVIAIIAILAALLLNDAAVDPFEDESTIHGNGAIVGCYGGSAGYMPFREWKQQQCAFPSRLNCAPP